MCVLPSTQAALLLPPTLSDESTWNHTFLWSYLSSDDVGTNGNWTRSEVWTPDVQYRFQTTGEKTVSISACNGDEGLDLLWRFPHTLNGTVFEAYKASNPRLRKPGEGNWGYGRYGARLWPAAYTAPEGEGWAWYYVDALDTDCTDSFTIKVPEGTYEVVVEPWNYARYTKYDGDGENSEVYMRSGTLFDTLQEVPPFVGTITLTNATMLAYETNGTWRNTPADTRSTRPNAKMLAYETDKDVTWRKSGAADTSVGAARDLNEVQFANA